MKKAIITLLMAVVTLGADAQVKSNKTSSSEKIKKEKCNDEEKAELARKLRWCEEHRDKPCPAKKKVVRRSVPPVKNKETVKESYVNVQEYISAPVLQVTEKNTTTYDDHSDHSVNNYYGAKSPDTLGALKSICNLRDKKWWTRYRIEDPCKHPKSYFVFDLYNLTNCETTAVRHDTVSVRWVRERRIGVIVGGLALLGGGAYLLHEELEKKSSGTASPSLPTGGGAVLDSGTITNTPTHRSSARPGESQSSASMQYLYTFQRDAFQRSANLRYRSPVLYKQKKAEEVKTTLPYITATWTTSLTSLLHKKCTGNKFSLGINSLTIRQ